jgi:hypothetical protein
MAGEEGVRPDKPALAQSSENSPPDPLAGAGIERGLAEDELLNLNAAQKPVRPEETNYLHVAGRP